MVPVPSRLDSRFAAEICRNGRFSVMVSAAPIRMATRRFVTVYIVARDWNELQPGLQQAIQADMTSAWFMYIVLIVLVAFSVLFLAEISITTGEV